jgi:proteasome accessory factor A
VDSERGLYHVLARHGEVEKLVPEETIECARHSPPQTTRARLRGDFIRRATLQGREYQVDWAFVRTISGEDSQTVICQDPFVAHDERVEQLVA